MTTSIHYNYTLDHIHTNMLLLITHLRELESKPREFCNDCVFKHATKLVGFLEEAMQFIPNGKHIWPDLIEWAQNIRLKIKSLTPEEANKIADEGRLLWKEISKIPREEEHSTSIRHKPSLLCHCIGQPGCECDPDQQ